MRSVSRSQRLPGSPGRFPTTAHQGLLITSGITCSTGTISWFQRMVPIYLRDQRLSHFRSPARRGSTNHAHVLKFESDVQRSFVEIYLNSIDLAPFVTGGAQAKLSQANLNRIPIPLLSVDAQQRVVSFLEDVRVSIEELAASLGK